MDMTASQTSEDINHRVVFLKFFCFQFSFVLCIISVSSEFLLLFVLVPTFHVRSFLICLLIFGRSLVVLRGLQI